MFAVRNIHLGMAVLVLIAAPDGRAQNLNITPLIPTDDWRLVRSEPLDVSRTARLGGDPVVEREYGVKKMELRHYQLGAIKAEALLKEASDPTAAYGLLTYYRTEELTPDKGLDMAFVGPSTAFAARGRVCIRVRPAEGSELTRSEFRALLVTIGGARLSRDEAGDFPAPLPAKGLIAHSERYLLGLETARRVLPDFRTDLIGFTQGAEVRVGEYSTGAETSTVVAVTYPTPQIARVRYGAMESMLGINRDNGISGKRSGSFVFLALNTSGSEATKLLEQFQVTSSINWNEPKPEAERFAADLAELILSILALVFTIAAIAVIGGVLMVTSRSVAQRFFPDSGWANPDRDKVIRLNL